MGTFSGSIGASWVWLHLHWLFWGIAIFGFVVALIWMSKYAKKDEVKRVMWTTLILGVLGGLLTIPLARTGWYDMMNFNSNGSFKTMMGNEDFAETMFDFMKDEFQEASN